MAVLQVNASNILAPLSSYCRPVSYECSDKERLIFPTSFWAATIVSSPSLLLSPVFPSDILFANLLCKQAFRSLDRPYRPLHDLRGSTSWLVPPRRRLWDSESNVHRVKQSVARANPERPSRHSSAEADPTIRAEAGNPRLRRLPSR